MVLGESLKLFGSELFAVDRRFSTTPDGAFKHFDSRSCTTLIEGSARSLDVKLVDGMMVYQLSSFVGIAISIVAMRKRKN